MSCGLLPDIIKKDSVFKFFVRRANKETVSKDRLLLERYLSDLPDHKAEVLAKDGAESLLS